MQSIREFMAGDHRRCDDLFAEAEQAVAQAQWERAAEAFALFREAVLQHFAAEEATLFPAFEERTGMRMGPTQVMRGEHVQMRELIEAAGEGLAERDADAYTGNAETLLIMMQQHNMKEENVLYPMCDQNLAADAEALVPRLQREMPGSTA